MKNILQGGYTCQKNPLADKFNRSIDIDIKLYKQDIQGSIAHSKMLAKCKIISNEDALLIQNELKNILAEIESKKLVPSVEEDVHMFVEGVLTNRIGDAGKRLHTARSRNDQVATDFRLYTKESIDQNISMLNSLVKKICEIAEKNKSTIMCGYTHLQKAQPITLAHHLLAYCNMFLRDMDRFADCKKRTDYLPLGSGALATTTYPIDREFVAKELGFANVCTNSLDAVSDRDFVCEYIFCASTVFVHISRLCEEIITWASAEFAYIKIDDSFSTASSIMPQKRNPDIAELLRGKSGRVFGDLISMLTILKGLPLAYNKDLQEDKNALLDCEDTLQQSLQVLTEFFDHITFNVDRMQQNALCGNLEATDVADFLTKKGVPFRTAYTLVSKISTYTISNNTTIAKIPLEKMKEFSPLFDESLMQAIKLQNMVENRNVIGSPASNQTQKEIDRIKKLLK